MEILNTKNYTWIIVVMAMTCFALYSGSLQNGFLLDDYPEILEKSILHDLKHLPYVLKNIEISSGQNIELHHRPVSSVVRMLLYHFFQGQAFYYHLFNILLFLTNGWLLFLLVVHLTQDRILSFSTSILFIVHPLNTIAVNFVTAHEVLLLGIFSLLTALALLISLEQNFRNQRVLYYGLSLFFFALCLLTQEITMSLPGFIFLIALLVKKLHFRKSALLVLPYVLMVFGYILFKLSFANRSAQSLLTHLIESRVGVGEYVGALIQLMGWYFNKLLFPTDIVLMWSVKAAEPWTHLGAVVGFLGAVIFFGGILRYCKNDLKFFAFFWFLLGLVPVSILCFIYYYPLGFVIEPHWFFFSQSGFFLLVAMVLKDIQVRVPRWAWSIGFIALLVSWGRVVQAYTPVWKNEKSYAQYWVNIVSHNAYALRALGKAYAKEGEHEKALFYINQSLSYLHNAALYHDIAEIYIQMNQLGNAKKYLQKCLEVQPDYEHAYNTLGTIYAREKDLSKAQEFFRKALTLDPFDITALLNLADVYILENKTIEAIQTLQKILDIDPRHSERRNTLAKLAVLYSREKDFDKSFVIINTMVQENPSPDTFLTLSMAFKTMGNPYLALSVLDSCLKLYPNLQPAYLMYGGILMEIKNYKQALKVWESGLKVIPGDEELKKNIRMVKGVLSQVKD